MPAFFRQLLKRLARLFAWSPVDAAPFAARTPSWILRSTERPTLTQGSELAFSASTQAIDSAYALCRARSARLKQEMVDFERVVISSRSMRSDLASHLETQRRGLDLQRLALRRFYEAILRLRGSEPPASPSLGASTPVSFIDEPVPELRGNTLLSFYASIRDIESCKALLALGADPDAASSDGKTAVQRAERRAEALSGSAGATALAAAQANEILAELQRSLFERAFCSTLPKGDGRSHLDKSL